MQELTDFESRVLDMLFAGNHPQLVRLRLQASRCVVTDREWTGCGFFADIKVSDETPALSLRKEALYFGDVFAEIQGLDYGMGFVVKLEAGYLVFIEGYTFGEPCPDAPQIEALSYTCEGGRDLSALGA